MEKTQKIIDEHTTDYTRAKKWLDAKREQAGGDLIDQIVLDTILAVKEETYYGMLAYIWQEEGKKGLESEFYRERFESEKKSKALWDEVLTTEWFVEIWDETHSKWENSRRNAEYLKDVLKVYILGNEHFEKRYTELYDLLTEELIRLDKE